MSTLDSTSPDTLPAKYTEHQLADYCMRKLGAPVWTIELTHQQALDSVQDALNHYSLWCPKRKYKHVKLIGTKYRYLEDEDNGLGVTDVQFLVPSSQPGALYYGNLLGTDTSPVLRTGVDDLDTFVRWRKTFARVTGIEPEWLWVEDENVLLIHNPIERYRCTAQIDYPYDDTRKLPRRGANWVREYALASSTYTYGEILSKYSGAVPAPVASIQLDQAKKGEAQARMDKLMEELRMMQESTPFLLD